MNKPRPLRLARRILLGAPALVAAALAVTYGRTAQARQTSAEPECASDVMGAN